MRPFILLFFIACVCFYSVSALSQSSVEIFIADFNNDSLRVVMEQHASSFLSDVNTAFIAEDSSLSTASYFSPSIGDEFALLWKNTPFYIPESIIIESVNVRTNGNYEVRNIPAYFVDKEGKKYYEDAVIQFTKGEYVERLKQLFFKNEWIDVGYNDIDIIKHPKYPAIYGVSLTQYYSSETYPDEGFLFLLIDFEDPKKPLIHVRTWQPKKVTPEDEVFHIGYMEIFK